MFIRLKLLPDPRLRVLASSFGFGSLCAVGLAASASAQQSIYAPELLRADVSISEMSGTSLSAPRAVSFSDLEALLREHPSLDAIGFTAEAHRNRAKAALGLPDPVISFQLNNVPLFDPSFSEYLPSNKAVGIQQALPSGSERRANSLRSLRSAEQQELERERQFAALRGQMLVYLLEKKSIEQQREYAQQRQSKYDELADIIDIEINAGRPLIFRLAKVDVERTEVSRTLVQLDGDKAEIDAELINLLSFIPETVIPPLSKTAWTGNALNFYGVRVADATVGIAVADIDRAEADFKPDWGVNLTYQQRESGQGPRSNFDGEDWVSGGFSFTVPLWAGQRQDPNLRAAKNDKSASLARRTAVARQLQAEWARYEAGRKTAVKNIRILTQKISAIEDQIAAQLITYESGLGDYSPILDGEIAVLMLRAEIVKEDIRRDQMIAKMNSLLVPS